VTVTVQAETTLLVLVLLGALHGLNPAMGWLFAVSLGLQEQRRAAVWRALVPLAAGHALAIGAAVILAAALGWVLPLAALKWITASALLAFGILKLFQHRHPRAGGMRVGARDLAVWSFLMASAHGAGLMTLPFVLGSASEVSATHSHAAHMTDAFAAGASSATLMAANGGVLAVITHTAGYLAVAGILAVVVYEKLGLRLLRTAWVNLDLVWAGALIVTALLTPLL
jgi:hypothetical protein